MLPLFNAVSSVMDLVSSPVTERPPSGPLEPGDILMKMTDGSAVNIAINLGQSSVFLGSGHSLWSHAGLAVSSTVIAEMDGNGLQHDSLAGQNAGYTYAVFRCRYQQVARAACEANAKLHSFGKKVVYSKAGAAASLLPPIGGNGKNGRLKNAVRQMESGKTFSLFCSEHVVFCYLSALEDPDLNLPGVGEGPPPISLDMKDFFAKDPWQYSPAYLYTMLLENRSFRYIGRWHRMRWL